MKLEYPATRYKVATRRTNSINIQPFPLRPSRTVPEEGREPPEPQLYPEQRSEQCSVFSPHCAPPTNQ